MITPVHTLFNLLIYFIVNKTIISPNLTDLILLLLCELIDLDHLFSKPIYHPKRNPFKTHFLHKKWIILSLIAILMILFYRPLMFLGIGILSHFLLDYIYIKMKCVK